jgi:hypothetical protein
MATKNNHRHKLDLALATEEENINNSPVEI